MSDASDWVQYIAATNHCFIFDCMNYFIILPSFISSVVLAYELVAYNQSLSKLSELSAIYASPNLFTAAEYPALADVQTCMPEPKYSKKRYQMTLKSGYANTLKFSWRINGVPPPPPATPSPQITSVRGRIQVSGFPPNGWAASTFEYDSRVYTLSKIVLSATSQFYVTPLPNSPKWFQLQVDFVHLMASEGRTLVVSALYTVGFQSSLLLGPITTNLLTKSKDFTVGQLNLANVASIELRNFRDGYYVLKDTNGTSGDFCRGTWIVSNTLLSMDQNQYNVLMQNIAVIEPSDSALAPSSDSLSLSVNDVLLLSLIIGMLSAM